MMKRIIAFVIAFAFMCCSANIAYADNGVDELLEISSEEHERYLSERAGDGTSDNTFATANNMNLGSRIQGSITETDNLDYYKFKLGSAGCVTLNMTAYMKYYCILIYGSDGKEIWRTENNEWTESVGYQKRSHTVYLEQGFYYMQVNGYWYGTFSKSTGTYMMNTSFRSSGVTNIEDDNSFATANKVAFGNTIVGQISANDNYDTYSFSLIEPGCVALDVTSYMQYYCILLYNSDGEEIWKTDSNEWNSNVGYRKDEYSLYLEAGTYFMQVNGYWYGTFSKSTGKYVVNTEFESSGVTFEGEDNSLQTANEIEWNKVYTGQISINDDFDTYQFTVSSDGQVRINITSYMQYYCIRIFDTSGKEIWKTESNEWNSNVGYRKDVYKDLVLNSGTYYMQVNGYWYGTFSKSTGTYKFYIDRKKAAEDNPIQIKPGHNKEKIRPAQVTAVSAARKSKALSLKWKRVSGAKGYQVYYSTSSDFTRKGIKTTTKNSLAIKKLLKKRTYYVKIRAYKIIDGERIYGKFSKVVKKKTK